MLTNIVSYTKKPKHYASAFYYLYQSIILISKGGERAYYLSSLVTASFAFFGAFSIFTRG